MCSALSALSQTQMTDHILRRVKSLKPEKGTPFGRSLPL